MRKRLTTSVSMINLSAPNVFDELDEVKQRTSKVSFEFHPSKPSQDHHCDDSNNCEVILENIPHSDCD